MELQKKTTLIAVKVLGCNGSGSYAGVIAGIQWVADSYGQRNRPSVANLSLGGPISDAINNAVKNVILAGVTFVVAGGNDNKNSCNYSPASCKTALTVGATALDSDNENQIDARAFYSNYGSCISLFAPGSAITSTWIGALNNEIRTISGTSMASPHVAGIAALHLGSHPDKTPAQVKAWFLEKASSELVRLDCEGAVEPTRCNESPNLFAFSPC